MFQLQIELRAYVNIILIADMILCISSHER